MSATLNVAVKKDSGKPPISLIPRCAVEAEARVLGFGAKKYEPDNHRKGFAWRRLIDAALRHVLAVADGEDRDSETGELHTAHARCMLGFLHEHMERGLGVDDRYHFGAVTPVVNAPALHVISPASPQAEVGWHEPPGAPAEQRAPFTYWYLATPYSKYPFGHDAAFEMAACAAAKLMENGVAVFCPITHSHPASKFIGSVANTDHDFWLNIDRPMMRAAGGLIVYKAQSWEVSDGMAKEIEEFRAAGKPVVEWHPSDPPPLHRLGEHDH